MAIHKSLSVVFAPWGHLRSKGPDDTYQENVDILHKV